MRRSDPSGMNYDPIEIDHESFTVHAVAIAENLGVEPGVVLVGMRKEA